MASDSGNLHLLLRSSVLRKGTHNKGGQVWSFTIPGGGVSEDENKHAVFDDLYRGKNGLKWLDNYQKTYII